ncbi:MAG: hypothetical protein JWO56_3215 [Acidobacteria bacterium]|nr:hypothetical protein [Acidobacteriota bacterium]
MLLTLSAALPLLSQTLAPAATRDSKIVRRWSLTGEPRGVAVGRDGTIYVGLAKPQAVAAIDPKTGTVTKQVVLDSAEIASTKELVTLRITPDGTRLVIANGSDESATILSLPDLGVLREITMEGEAIRDALPDPKGRYLYLLGRRVHVFDADGQTELHTLRIDDPMAIAASANGTTLAILGSETFGENKATVAALYDTTSFTELTRDPMQTDKPIEAALFADNDRVLMALGREWLYEKAIASHQPARTMTSDGGAGPMRMRIDFGDLTSSERACLPEGSGPQIATLASPTLLLYAERRCSTSGVFTGSNRRVTPASLYGVTAYAIAYDSQTNTLVTTDKAGFLTIYKVPRAAVVR